VPNDLQSVSIGDYYTPNPGPQTWFHECDAKYPLMEGGRGGGKSLALLWEAIIQCILVPGCNCLLLRRTLTAVEKGGIEDHFSKYVPKNLYRSFNQSKHIVIFHNGSKLFFGHIRTEKDLMQYQGAEFLFIGWEELTQFTYSQWDFMKGSNRCPIKTYWLDEVEYPVQPRMAGGTNPNGKGSGWVKALWITHRPPAGMFIPDYDPRDYVAIHSTYADNPTYANDKDYISKLHSISDPVLREAWIPGSWDILAGQFFQNWDNELHVIGGKDSRLGPSDVKYMDWQPRWISIDWGFQHACVILWWTIVQVPANFSGDPKNIILCYRELVVRQLNEELLAEKIASANHTGERFDKIAHVYLSPDRFTATGSGADAIHSIADKIGDVFGKYDIPRPERANNRRIDGWRLCYTLLDTEGVAVLNTCRDVLDSLPKLMRSEKEIEDAEKEGDELFLDVCESFRYGLMSYATTAPIPRDVANQERIKAIKDPTQKYQEYLRITSKPQLDDMILSQPQHGPSWRRR
jgi:Phage terminase large subunit